MKAMLIGNFDSFAYNLADEFKKRDCEVIAYRDDSGAKIINDAIRKFKPSLIVILGYGNVKSSGNSVDIIRSYQGQIPIFGVGLGLLCIIEAFEGKVGKIPLISHGKMVKISHDGKTIFRKINNPFYAGAYNSFIATYVPYSLEVSARSENDIVMAVRHKECFVEGIQFDPGSLLTPSGSLIIENVLRGVGRK